MNDEDVRFTLVFLFASSVLIWAFGLVMLLFGLRTFAAISLGLGAFPFLCFLGIMWAMRRRDKHRMRVFGNRGVTLKPVLEMDYKAEAICIDCGGLATTSGTEAALKLIDAGRCRCALCGGYLRLRTPKELHEAHLAYIKKTAKRVNRGFDEIRKQIDEDIKAN